MQTSASQTARTLRDKLGLLSDRELADILDLTTDTLQTWRTENKGPAFTHLGKRVFYRLADVQAWIESCVKYPVTSTTTAHATAEAL